MTTVEPEALPFTTAPEYVDEFLADVTVSQEVADRAHDYAETYGLEESLNRSPRSVAAAAIYWSALELNEKVTQEELHNATGVSQPAIRETYHEIVDAEGHPYESEKNERERQERGVLDRVMSWGGR